LTRWILLAIAIVLVGGVLALVKFSHVTVRIPYGDSDAVARGGPIYAKNCASCHGKNLEGRPNWRMPGPNGRLPAPPQDVTGQTWRYRDQQLFDITKYGMAKFTPPDYQTDMLGYENVLSDDEILAVLAYIKASWPRHIQHEHDQMGPVPE
jgi:mono/diheme cytochrome c family protein